MPDWLTHTLIGWITGKTLKQNIALILIGSLLPDLVKINLLFTWLEINHHGFFDTLHTPIGALLTSGIIALLFPNPKQALLPILIGVSTHFTLDLFLVHVHGGMKLLFPLTWQEWQLYLIRSDDYLITILAILITITIYCIWNIYQNTSKQRTS